MPCSIKYLRYNGWCTFRTMQFLQSCLLTRGKYLLEGCLLICIPNTVSGLHLFLPDYLPVNLVCSPKPSPDLPNYDPVGTCGVTIYACATFKQKEAACHYISANGPPVLPSQSIYLFSTSTLPISAGKLG